MGTIKIDFDLPDFENELNINVIIRRDGEVYTTSSSSSGNFREETLFEKSEPQKIKSQKKTAEKKEDKTSTSTIGGNMMGIEL